MSIIRNVATVSRRTGLLKSSKNLALQRYPAEFIIAAPKPQSIGRNIFTKTPAYP